MVGACKIIRIGISLAIFFEKLGKRNEGWKKNRFQDRVNKVKSLLNNLVRKYMGTA